MTSSTSSFRAARDLLLRYRDDYDAALGSFEWPSLDEFNWALDWFDVIDALYQSGNRAASRQAMTFSPLA